MRSVSALRFVRTRRYSDIDCIDIPGLHSYFSNSLANSIPNIGRNHEPQTIKKKKKRHYGEEEEVLVDGSLFSRMRIK